MSMVFTQHQASEAVFLSIIIPAYNEAKRLPKTLEAADRYLSTLGVTYEWVLVNDGSRDHTRQIMDQWADTHHNTRVVSYCSNRGKGNAVKEGVLAARGRYCLLYDADGATPMDEIRKFLDCMGDYPDTQMLLGCRLHRCQPTYQRYSRFRKFIGKVYRQLCHGLIKDIKDTQCGFKLFRRLDVLPLFQRAAIRGFAFDVEIIHAAQHNRFVIAEIPVSWEDVTGSKVNLMVDSWVMFFSLFCIALRSRQGCYTLPDQENELLIGRKSANVMAG